MTTTEQRRRTERVLNGVDRALDSGRRPAMTTVAVAVALVAVGVFSVAWSATPPAPVPADAPATEFSAIRAMDHITRLSQTPRPMGADAHAGARQYIVDELRGAGLNPTVAEGTAVQTKGGSPFDVGAVHNVVAVLPGAQGSAGGPRDAVLLSAHYDTVPVSPGANDNGASVASLLESARALAAGPRPAHDVVFLFTDGEEVGLLGSAMFAADDPLAKRVAVVINLESRGGGGPSAMFETSVAGPDLIARYAAAVSRPVASSAAEAVYAFLPSDSDLSEYREAGLTGVNLAYFRHPVHYDTSVDRAESVSLRSLQHHGAQTLALARAFANNAPTPGTAHGTGIYFDVLSLTVVQYSPLVAMALAVVALAILVVGALAYRRHRHAQVGPGVKAAVKAGVVALVAPLAAGFVVTGFLFLVRMFAGGRPVPISQGDVYGSTWFGLAALAAGVAVAAGIFRAAGARFGGRNLAVGIAGLWVLLSIATVVLLPGASYLFGWPALLLSVAVLADGWRSGRPAGRGWDIGSAAVLVVCGALSLVVVAPFAALLYDALTVGLAGVSMILIGLIVSVIAALVALADAQSERFDVATIVAAGRRVGGPVVTAVAAAAGLLVVVTSVTAMVADTDRDTPRLDSIVYALDADTGTAKFASLDSRVDDYTRRFLPDGSARGDLAAFLPPGPLFLPNGNPPAIVATAPVAAVSEPRLVVTGDRASANVRTVDVLVTPPAGARSVLLWLVPTADDKPGVNPVRSASVNGEPIGTGPANRGWGRWAVQFHAPPTTGFQLSLQVAADRALALRVVSVTDGLPTGLGVDPNRPDAFAARNVGLLISVPFRDATLVGKTFTITTSEGS